MKQSKLFTKTKKEISREETSLNAKLLIKKRNEEEATLVKINQIVKYVQEIVG